MFLQKTGFTYRVECGRIHPACCRPGPHKHNRKRKKPTRFLSVPPRPTAECSHGCYRWFISTPEWRTVQGEGV